MFMDFAVNFTCSYHDEVQPAHWHHEQVTIHRTVTYYKCPKHPETVMESLVFVSRDRVHDYHAAHHCQFNTRGIRVSKVVQWTDGCAAQCNSKGPFSDIVCAPEDLGATMARNFFGSRHGKEPSDGESAVAKNCFNSHCCWQHHHHQCPRPVWLACQFTSARDLFGLLANSKLNKQPPEHGCCHSLRVFFWVGENDINRNKAARKIATIPGTRGFHSVKCLEKNKLLTQYLSCSCASCRSDGDDFQITGLWASHALNAVQLTLFPQM